MKPAGRLIRVLLAVAVLSASTAAAYWRWSLTNAPAPPLRLHGNVEVRETELALRQGGRLTRILVQEGDRVTPGQLLAEIDSDLLQDKERAAAAEVRGAQAELDRLLSGNRIEDVSRAEAILNQARAASRRTVLDFERTRALRDAGFASEGALEVSRSAKEEAAAAEEAARQAVMLQRRGARPEDIAVARARVAAAAAQHSLARAALQDARLLAPLAGTVVSRLKEPGALIGAGEPLITLAPDGPAYVRAYAPEPRLVDVPPGAEVLVHADGLAQPLRGQVGFVSPKAEFTPRNVETESLRSDLVYRLRVVVPAHQGRLRQGMPVTVTLQAPRRG